MKNPVNILPLVFLLILTGCENSSINRNENSSDIDGKNTNENVSNDVIPIEIGDYVFEFPSEFELIEEQGIDSYIGKLVGSEITLSFDFGWYTAPATGLSPDQYKITVDNIEGHYRQIVKSIDPEFGFARVHLYNINDALASPHGYNSLTMSASNVTFEEQELVIDIFNSGLPIE